MSAITAVRTIDLPPDAGRRTTTALRGRDDRPRRRARARAGAAAPPRLPDRRGRLPRGGPARARPFRGLRRRAAAHRAPDRGVAERARRRGGGAFVTMSLRWRRMRRTSIGRRRPNGSRHSTRWSRTTASNAPAICSIACSSTRAARAPMTAPSRRARTSTRSRPSARMRTPATWSSSTASGRSSAGTRWRPCCAPTRSRPSWAGTSPPTSRPRRSTRWASTTSGTHRARSTAAISSTCRATPRPASTPARSSRAGSARRTCSASARRSPRAG